MGRVPSLSARRIAALTAVGDGQFNLGVMYEDCEGVPEDYVRAYARGVKTSPCGLPVPARQTGQTGRGRLPAAAAAQAGVRVAQQYPSCLPVRVARTQTGPFMYTHLLAGSYLILPRGPFPLPLGEVR